MYDFTADYFMDDLLRDNTAVLWDLKQQAAS